MRCTKQDNGFEQAASDSLSSQTSYWPTALLQVPPTISDPLYCAVLVHQAVLALHCVANAEPALHSPLLVTVGTELLHCPAHLCDPFGLSQCFPGA